MDYAKHIASLEATRKEKSERQKAIHQKPADESRTMNSAESEEFDTLDNEIKALNVDIERTKRMQANEEADKATAKPVDDKTKANATAGTTPLTADNLALKQIEKLQPGIGFARMARAKAIAFKERIDPMRIAESLYPQDENLQKAFKVEKDVVSAANTGNAPWAGNLVLDGGAYFADFVEYARSRSLLGQISGRLQELPINTNVAIQTSGGTAKWTKEGQAKPLTSWGYTTTKLLPFKVTAIAAATEEMLARSSISIDTLIRNELVKAVNARIDGTFASDAAAVTDESPAGILEGTTPLTLGGDGSVAGIRCDIAQFINAILGVDNTLNGAFWVMPESVAVNLSLIANEVGATAFGGIGPAGGTFAGLPVYTSGYVPTESAGPVVMLIKGDEIYLGDEGGIRVKVSDQASLIMNDTPTGNSTTPTAAQMVSMWQTNSVAFLVERYITWAKRNAGSVVWANVNWNTCTS